jgi:flagellar assembly factor FliW
MSQTQSNSSDGTVRFDTTRFGPIDIAAERVIRFRDGILGFPEAKRFALIQADHFADSDPDGSGDGCIFWLQNVDDPKLAFVVCDPTAFIGEYDLDEIPLRGDCRSELNLPAASAGGEELESLQVLVICNRVGGWLTGNLMGPLVVNVESFVGMQIVLPEQRWGTRHPLLQLEADGKETVGRIGEAEETSAPLRKTA